MASSLAMRARTLEANGLNGALVDLETRATKGDHQALRLWLRLLSCTVRIENHVRGGLRQDFETTLPRFDLMAQLERHPDGLRMSEVSKRLMVSCGNVTGITDQLELEGLVIRKLDRRDRRALTVKLTETGLKRFREMAAQHELWIVELFRGLSSEEKQIMFDLLHKLKAHLSSLGAACSAPPKVASLHRRK
jgi:DNA-binding MarR family transcriptional regulator